jgi:small subunit ribosomal protein S16
MVLSQLTLLRAILSYTGALLKHHLDGGVRKGALTQEQADAKLATWLEEKAGKVDAKKDLVYLKQKLMQKQKHLKLNKKQTQNVLLLKLKLRK